MNSQGQYTTTNEVSITKDEGAYVLGLMEQNKKLKEELNDALEYGRDKDKEIEQLKLELQEWIEGYEKLQRQN